MYASLLISLLAAFIAMLGKQWLNRYLRNTGGSMIERCGDRQRKCDGLNRWPFHLFVESLPIMLQFSLLLLACGLCRHMCSINTHIAIGLIILTVLGVLFYLGVVIAGACSYECPFQTPLSTSLRNLWEKIGPDIVTAGAILYKCLPWSLWFSALRNSWEIIQCQMLRVLLQLQEIKILYYFRSAPLQTVQTARQEPALLSASMRGLWENIQCKVLRLTPRPPQTLPPQTIPDTTLNTLREMNAGDIRCVSWILWNITDPEALDAAIRLAGTVRWFEDGTDVEPPYDPIIVTFRACFDSIGKLYPGLRDRAYASAQAILWIHIRAICVSGEFARRFPLPIFRDYEPLDPDLSQLLELYHRLDDPHTLWDYARRDVTPMFLQWTSNALLQLSWAKRNASVPEASHPDPIFLGITMGYTGTPLNARLNRLLASCILLGQSVNEELLVNQDKSCVVSRFCPPSRSHCCLLVVTWNRSYPKHPEHSFQPSAPPILTLDSSRLPCGT